MIYVLVNVQFKEELITFLLALLRAAVSLNSFISQYLQMLLLLFQRDLYEVFFCI
jgi:hypothetical protein